MGDVAALGALRPDLGPGMLWPPPRARRCLFGAPDPQRTQAILETETKKIEQKNRDRWNFDFIRGVPLEPGRFAWTPVTCGDSTESPDDDDESLEDAPEKKDEDDDASSGTSLVSTTPAEKQQKLITDYMRKRKSSHHTESSSDELEPKAKTRRRFST